MWASHRSQGEIMGHTIVVDGKKHKLHLCPRILRKDVVNIISNGCSNPVLLKELDNLDSEEANAISIGSCYNAICKLLDGGRKVQGKSMIGTGNGIGPCYSDKASNWNSNGIFWMMKF